MRVSACLASLSPALPTICFLHASPNASPCLQNMPLTKAVRFDIGVVLSRLGKNEGVGGAATLRVEMYQRVSQKASCVYVPSQRGDRRVLDMVVEGGDILAYFPAGMLERCARHSLNRTHTPTLACRSLKSLPALHL
mmetsp:Transcript_36258/g.89219  ORF Transcript_36258/g.89219 Transcript_36258/m.89219 type:complete len:137 (-) Transcript_36258:526-936(-)